MTDKITQNTLQLTYTKFLILFTLLSCALLIIYYATLLKSVQITCKTGTKYSVIQTVGYLYNTFGYLYNSCGKPV